MWNLLSGKWRGVAASPSETLKRELSSRQSALPRLPQHPLDTIATRPRVAGVYLIANRANGRAYVSGDHDVHGAIARDRADLRRGRHRNERLQADWNWHGEENFALAIVATVDDAACEGENRGTLTRLVDTWRDDLRTYGDTGYNAHARVAF